MKEQKGRNGGTLHTYEKGESGNPNGRPKGKSFKSLLKQFLAYQDVVEGMEKAGEITKKQALALLLVRDATNPKGQAQDRHRAAVIVMEKLEGKPTSKVEAKVENTNDREVQLPDGTLLKW